MYLLYPSLKFAPSQFSPDKGLFSNFCTVFLDRYPRFLDDIFLIVGQINRYIRPLEFRFILHR